VCFFAFTFFFLSVRFSFLFRCLFFFRAILFFFSSFYILVNSDQGFAYFLHFFFFCIFVFSFCCSGSILKTWLFSFRWTNLAYIFDYYKALTLADRFSFFRFNNVKNNLGYVRIFFIDKPNFFKTKYFTPPTTNFFDSCLGTAGPIYVGAPSPVTLVIRQYLDLTPTPTSTSGSVITRAFIDGSILADNAMPNHDISLHLIGSDTSRGAVARHVSSAKAP